jgi:toxin ParE1/3/4
VILTVQFTPPARAQFLAAVAYIRADRPAAARGFRARVNDALAVLVDFPESGRVIPEFPQMGFREVLVDSYRFFYRVKGDKVWVGASSPVHSS